MAEQNALNQFDQAEPGLHEELLEIMRGPALQVMVAAIMAELRQRIGGRMVYVHRHDPVTYQQRIQTRDEAVRAAFNGRNRREVCAQFGIKRTLFYKITGGKALRRDAKLAPEVGFHALTKPRD